MEGGARVVTVSYNENEIEQPIIKTIKCEYDSLDEASQIGDHAMHFLEEGPDDEESFIDQYERDHLTSLTTDTKSSVFPSTRNLHGIFKCFRCSFTCTSIKELATHYKRYRETEPFNCFHCGYACENKEDFFRHSHTHFGNTYFRCSKCPFRSETSFEIRAHVQKHDREPLALKFEKMKCPFCEKFISKQTIKYHLMKCDTVYKNILTQKENSVKTAKENPSTVVIKEELKEENPNPVYTCPHCFFIFSSKFKRSKHIYSVHFQEENKRVLAQNDDNEEVEEGEEEVHEEFSDYEKFGKDDVLVKVGPDMNPSVQLERIYLCPICHYVFTSVSSLNEHVVSHTSITECPICKENFDTNQELKMHMNSHSKKSGKKSKFSCTICDKSFITLGKLKYHMKEEHSKGLKCPYCPRMMKSESILKFHIEAHSKRKAFYCPKCKFAAKNSSLLQFHMSKFHPTKKRYSCSICNKGYMYKYSLARHEENCPGKEESSSTFEDKSKEVPEIEIDISQKEKLSCSECKATFKEATHLKKHLLVHFHQTPFRCMKCGFRCKTKHTLTVHMKIHNMKANYQCKICLQKFKHKYALNNHSIRHSEKRPYTCEVCEMTFKRKANYRRHYDTHSEVKPFKCPLCDFTSRRKDGLYKHLETHEKDK